MIKKTIHSIDAYILQCPAEVQAMLNQIREAIKEVAPEAEEKISYQIPTFYLNGNLVHFAANKNTIGFYPTPSAISAFKEALEDYKVSKGSVQFPMNTPLPIALIKKMVAFRVQENRHQNGME